MSHELSKPDNTAELSTDLRWDDKFDKVLRWDRDERPEDDPKRFRISKDLQLQAERWNLIYGLINTGRYGKTSQRISAIMKAFPGISPRTARTYLADTMRFFSVLDAPVLAFERVTHMDDVRDTMRLAKRKGDLRSYGVLAKLYADMIGATKPEEAVENKTVINILNYNPASLGGTVMDETKLNDLIKRITAADKKKAETLFDDYEDVSEK